MSFAQKSWRISPMYLFYFSIFGTFVPYVARFLTTNGLTGQEASLIVAVFNGVNMFAPFLFSYLADRSGRRMGFIRFGYVAIGLFYVMSLFGTGFWFYLSIFGLFGTFMSAVLPQMESLVLSVLGDEKKRYGQIRLWGSIGFVVIVWIIGFMLDVYSVSIIPIFGGVISLLMFLSTYLIPEAPKQTVEKDLNHSASHAFTINWMQVVILLMVVLFWQFSMAPYNTLFDLYLREHGYSATTNGFLIGFGSLCEISIFVYMSTLFGRFSERNLMNVALLISALRWLLVYQFADHFWVVLLSQTLHAASFGMVHSVVIHRIAHLFPESRSSFGQGLYIALGTGLGLFLGNIMSGSLWNGTGNVFLMAAGWCVLALVISFFGIRDDSKSVANDVTK